MRALRLDAKVAILGILGVLVLGEIMLPRTASALHDQGYICYVCHSLNPSEIRSGSNSIRTDQAVLTPVPVSPSGSTAWTGGMPITCDFCHKTASDVPIANFASKTYHHPVRTISDNGAISNEIACGDCHWGNADGDATRDLTPESMTTKSTTDGYPDHDNVAGVYAHTLVDNPPHLTAPYWSNLSLPGVTRANDTTFWTAVRGGTQDIVCWVCHEGAGRTSAPTSAPLTNRTSTLLVKGDYTGTGSAKGHQVRTNAGGSQLGVGAALPCYDCHDSHGSVNHAFVLDNQSIYGTNASRVAVTAYNQGARPYNDRVVCAQCHDTGLSATGAGTRVEGLNPMDPFNSSATIHSAAAGFADNMLLGSRNCLARNAGCHATPHNPIGESDGGQGCSVCHSAVYEAMNAGSNTGYHHVMLADNAPIGGTYPTNAQPTTTAQDRTCTICHVDHNYFSRLVDPGHLRAQNLRRDITVQPDNGANAPLQIDYDNTLARGGICTSCHMNTQTKSQPGTNIKNDGSTTTPVVSRAYYGSSAHNYPSTSPYIQSHFSSDNTDANSYYRSNCTKCHNDTASRDFQDNTTGFQFGLHASDGASAVNKLLAPLGYTPLTDNLSENFCYRCHSHSTDAIGGTRKTADGSDWYNNRAMTQAAENVWGDFQGASRHPVLTADQKGGTAVVECASCHNVHLTRSATGSIVAYPDNTYAFDNYVLTDATQAGKQNRARFCLRCHDGSPPAYVVSATSYVPLTVRVDNASMNKWSWGGLPDNSSNRGHWNVYGQLQATTIRACDACHDKHGSGYPKLIEATINGQAVTGNNNTVCQACHAASGLGYDVPVATYEGYREAGTGYFSPTPSGSLTTVRWPGYAVWDNTSLIGGAPVSPHRQTVKTGPAALGGLAVSDCKGCHDPHGTAYRYNMLTDNMTSTNFRLCFDCHGRSGSPAGTDNIARHYPTGVQGLSGDAPSSTNVGHNVKSTGSTYLAQYAALPCYDCHMTHGSLRGNTQLKSDQRWSGLGNTKYGTTPSDNAADNASRTFCLGCHVASDDGAAKPDTVEGLSRQSGRLKLPTANPIAEHTSAWLGQGCQRCHYGYTYLDNSFGPHYPGTGLCDTCHESQGTRSAAAATYNGAHRTHTDNTLYRFACKQCHTWTATPARAVHKNDNNATQHAEVRFDNQATSGWSLIQYATVTQYEYRSLYASPYGASAPAPGYTPAGTDNATTDGRRASVRWTNGTCANVWCHSNANPVQTVQGALGVSNQYQGVAWLDNSLGATCTGCHGGDAASGRRIGDNTAPTNGSISHLKHINGGAGCFKCHYYTVNTANSRQVDNLVSHVNGTKDVVFAPSVGGTWNNTAKTCAGTSCHGTPTPSPEWDNLATVTGCAVCHQSQGPGNTFTFTGPHQAHTDNATYRTACEACHANFASGAGPNAVHADGDNSVGNPRTVQVAFTDCAASQAYNSRVYYSSNLKFDPFLPGAVTPTYTENTAFVGGDNDSVNQPISWSRGTCNTVWCHSNANPLLGSGTTTYRAPQWAGAQPCTYCHAGAAAFASMQAADNLSRVHAQHAATNLYNFTCDACHAWTVANDCTVAINGATGYDNHVNGVKTVRFDSNFKGSIDMSGGTYDNTAPNYRCYNTYCHSNGTDNGTFNTAAQWPVDNTVGWDNNPTATCRACHGWTAASGAPIATRGHDNHVSNAAVLGANYSCSRCHSQTVGADNQTIASYALHVNGYKNVAFSENAAWATYAQAPSRTCSNTFCHRQGNRSLTGAEDNLVAAWDCTVDTNCRTCHGSRTGAGYTQFGASRIGEPNYDNAAFGGGLLTANSHFKHISATDNTTRCSKCHPDASATAVNALATDNWAMHINDNVEVRGGNGASFAWVPGSHRCNDISCHGGSGTTAQWGEQLNCQNCHAGAGDVEDFGTLGNPASLSGNGRTARIDNTEWTTRGHGRTSTSYPVTGHAAAAFTGTGQCAYCHESTFGHDNTSNIFRLANADVYGNGWNDVCLVCHRRTGGHAGYLGRNATVALVDNNHYGGDHGATNNGGRFCYDCHDPHGDNNIFMVGARTARRTDGTYGIPYRTTIDDDTYRPGVAFTDNATGGNYASTDNVAPYNGICEACHTTAIHYRSTGRTDTSHSTNRCVTCHLHDAGFAGSGCDGCHGNAAGNNWPDNTAGAYSDRAGAHQKHVTAIGTGNSSCTTCHPGNPPSGHSTDTGSGPDQAEVNRMDNAGVPDNVADYWTTSYFGTITGGTDYNGVYRMADNRCANLVCHGGSGSLSPDWYYVADSAPPTWAAGMNISATDCAVGGTLQVQWARATDATNPVRYDLYMSTTNSAAAVYDNASRVYTDLVDNVVYVTGLVNSTNYYFGVRAKDSVTPPNVTTDNTISAARAPSGGGGGGYTCGTGTNTTYYAVMGALTGTYATNDGGQEPTLSGGQTTWAAGPPEVFGRQRLQTTQPATAQNIRIVYPDTVQHRFARFYLTDYTVPTCVGPNNVAANSVVSLRATANTDQYWVQLVDHNPLVANQADDRVLATAGPFTSPGGTGYSMPTFSLTFGQTVIEANRKLVLEVLGRANVNTDILRLYFGSNTTNNRIEVRVPIVAATLVSDGTPPTWTGGGSGIQAVDNQIGGAIRVSWNTATDSTQPVTYDLYRSLVPATLWDAPFKSNLGVTTLLDTDNVINGLTYYYGVRAKDGWTPANRTTNIDNVTATASGGGGGGGIGCNSCHGAPPASDSRNRGSHAKHTVQDNVATCDKCHPGASTTYTSAHQDGIGQLGFAGTAYNAIYAGNQLRYNDGAIDFYNDSSGYGILTGAAGDNTDNGTCSVAACHGASAPEWGNPATVTCSSCHAGTGDLDDFGTNGDPATMSGNLRRARIDNTEWTTRGHGRSGSNYPVTGHAPAAFTGTGQCAYCHQSAFDHDNTSNIFRLANYDYYGNGWNDVCLVCHRRTGGHAGYLGRNATVALVDSNHYGGDHGATNNGGRFCYDCHDPHGDNNIFMVGGRTARRTDGTYGIPYRTTIDDNTYRPGVAFTDNTTGLNYASTDNAAPYNGICEACHTAAIHYRNTGRTDATHFTDKCTTCHFHDRSFRGSGGTCVGCHASAQGSDVGGTSAQRRDTVSEFSLPSHHVQPFPANNAQAGRTCAACHWEGNLTTGAPDPLYHFDDNTAANRAVQLRVWNATTAPTGYVLGTTALAWRQHSTAERLQDDAILLNQHCLGCHSSINDTTQPFSAGADTHTPVSFAWDGQSVGNRYNQTTNTNFGKYDNTVFNVNPAWTLHKSYSAHYDTLNNDRGVATTAAWQNDGPTAGTIGQSNTSVACLDCHNSHGSSATGSTSDNLYVTSYNATNGGLYKTATNGESGYTATYAPTFNATYRWSSQATLCFGCHVNYAGDSGGGTPPRTYANYGHAANAIIAGYYDPVDWRNATAKNGQGIWQADITTGMNWGGSFEYKGNRVRGSHFKSESATNTTPSTAMNGLCSRCHDPHGITRNTTRIATANVPYAVPLLKNTWMTSPYFEDRPGNKNTSAPASATWSYNDANTTRNINNSGTRWGPRMIPFREYNRPTIVGGGYGTTGGGGGHDGFFIDENTFGVSLAKVATNVLWAFNQNNAYNIGGNDLQNLWASNNTTSHGTSNIIYPGNALNNVGIVINHITQNNSQFGMLCEGCHTAAQLLTTASKSTGVITHVHNTVKGYGGAGAAHALADIFPRNMAIGADSAGTVNLGGNQSQQVIGAYMNNSGEPETAFVEASGRPWDGFHFSWGLNLNRTGGQFAAGYVQNGYHQFPCSKCHTPHTSRLPRLMKTNCLDTGTVATTTQRHAIVSATGANGTNTNFNRFRATTTNNAQGANWSAVRAVHCHNNQDWIGISGNDTRWTDVTPW